MPSRKLILPVIYALFFLESSNSQTSTNDTTIDSKNESIARAGPWMFKKLSPKKVIGNDVLGAPKKAVRGVFGAPKNIMGALSPKNAIGGVLGAPKKVIGGVLSAPKNVIGGVLGAPKKVIGGVLSAPKNVMGSVLGAPKKIMNIVTAPKRIVDNIMQAPKRIMDNIKSRIVDAVLNKVGGIANKVKSKISNITGRWKDRIQGWKDKFKSALSHILPGKWVHVYNKDCGGSNRVCDKDGIYEWWGVPRWKFWAPKYKFLPWDDFKHNPLQVTDTAWKDPPLSKDIPGFSYTIPPDKLTPDFRLPEPPFLPKLKGAKREMNRFYRISPANKFLTKPGGPSGFSRFIPKWFRKEGLPTELGCYCVCVYKRLVPLSMGAVLTMKHILTTAMATDMVLKRYKNRRIKTLNNILGAWYEAWHSSHTNNDSYYMTPVRIHFHPEWNSPERVNRSHPLPTSLDLAVWTSYQYFWPPSPRAFFKGKNPAPYICSRWTNKRAVKSYMVPPEVPHDLTTIQVGCQFVRDMGRVPFPWFKYMIQMNTGVRSPCPKSEWDWFFCIEMHGVNGKLGADVGAALHLLDHGNRHGGLAGINSFSMKLRSIYFVNYYTVLDRHKVLNFLYDSYFGRIPPVFLDARFLDTQGSGSPALGAHNFEWKYEEPYKNPHWDKYYTPIWY